MSESEAAGKLIRIPGIVETAATKPSRSVGVPMLVAKGLSTGLFAMVELRMAKAPITHSTRKKRLSRELFGSCMALNSVISGERAFLAFAYLTLNAWFPLKFGISLNLP